MDVWAHDAFSFKYFNKNYLCMVNKKYNIIIIKLIYLLQIASPETKIYNNNKIKNKNSCDSAYYHRGIFNINASADGHW